MALLSGKGLCAMPAEIEFITSFGGDIQTTASRLWFPKTLTASHAECIHLIPIASETLAYLRLKSSRPRVSPKSGKCNRRPDSAKKKRSHISALALCLRAIPWSSGTVGSK